MLEYVNLHNPPCGCHFLLAWEETRVPHPSGTGWLDTLPEGNERKMRVVTQDEAEQVVQAKRDHPDWTPHITTQPQPAHDLCPLHAPLGYSEATYRLVLADNAKV